MNKNLITVILFVSILVGGIGGVYFYNHLVPVQKAVLSYPQPTSTPINSTTEMTEVVTAAVPMNNAIIPKRLLIPRIGVDAVVEKVGLDKNKNMDVPKGAMNVGWYSLGYKVGEVGNSVMAGHLDKKDGSAAVFYKLASLQIGDTFSVLGEDGRTLDFKVTNKQTYDTDSFPIAKVFGSSDKAMLNLITCSGDWDKGEQSYSKRTVIYSELVKAN